MLTADISKFAGSDIYWAFKSHDFYLFSFTAFMIWSHYSGQHDCYCCSEVVLYWDLGCYCDVQSCVSHCAGVNVILTNMDSGMLEDENIFFINCLLWIQFMNWIQCSQSSSLSAWFHHLCMLCVVNVVCSHQQGGKWRLCSRSLTHRSFSWAVISIISIISTTITVTPP